MSTSKAKALLIEAHELQEQASQEGTPAAFKEPVTERVKQAVQLAPNNRENLFFATLVLRPYAPAFRDTKVLVREYQDRLDRLGGPTDATLEIAGMSKDFYNRHHSSVQQSGSGCVVMVMTALTMFVFFIATTASTR